MKISFSFPTGLTSNFIDKEYPEFDEAVASSSLGVTENITGNGVIQYTIRQGIITTGLTSGIFALKWAQQVSSPVIAIIIKGSYMEVIEI